MSGLARAACWALGLAAAAGLTGCLDDGTRCEDGSLCRGALVCAPVEIGGCAEPGQAEACAAPAAEGDACTYGFVTGVCVGGLCRLSACGDGVVDPTRGEICDEGDNLPGDGCSADCRSDETCGNGTIDDAVGEQCDDGNANDHDGCQGTCVLQRCGDGVLDRGDDEVCDDGNNLDGDGCAAGCDSDEVCGNDVVDWAVGETCDDGNFLAGDACDDSCAIAPVPAWHVRTSAPGPAGRLDHAMALDAARGEIVLFGGVGVDRYADTWTWRSAFEPTSRRPAAAPPARSGAAAAYDVDRREVVMFGGYGGVTGLLDDTWRWRGASWQRTLGSAPPPRQAHGLAFDPSTRHVVLFGGRGASALADVWAWDGVGWRELQPAARPPARSGHVMATDAARGEILLFGGEADDGELLGDSWRWDGETWREVDGPGPSARRGAVVAQLGTDLILFGGEAADGELRNDTWAWDGEGWSQLAANGPSARRDAALAPLPGANALLLLSGLDADGYALADRWVFDGEAWIQVAAVDDSAATLGDWGQVRSAYDRASGEVVVVVSGTGMGGWNTKYVLAWTGSRWLSRGAISTSATPLLFFDEAAGRITIVTAEDVQDGMGTSDSFYDWRVYDGESWYVAASHQLLDVPMVGPSPIGYIPTRGVILHDYFASQPHLDAWDGTTWTDEVVAVGGASLQGLLWDPVAQRAVLTGGDGDAAVLFGWADDGSGLTSLLRTNDNTSRQLFFHDDLGVMCAVEHNSKTLERWDDAANQWRPMLSIETVDNLGAPVYDPRRREVVLPGAVRFLQTAASTSSVTWEGAATEACGAALDGDADGLAGCDDPHCWASCTPLCPPYLAACPETAPRCGDGTCDPLEACTSCPGDCGACEGGVCGDGRCDPDEADAGACPGDCGA